MDCIVLHTEFVCKSGTVEAYTRDMEEKVCALARQEEGNLQYEFTISCYRPDTAILVEKWRDRAAFTEHAKMPYVQPEYLKEVEQGRLLDVKGEMFE